MGAAGQGAMLCVRPLASKRHCESTWRPFGTACAAHELEQPARWCWKYLHGLSRMQGLMERARFGRLAGVRGVSPLDPLSYPQRAHAEPPFASTVPPLARWKHAKYLPALAAQARRRTAAAARPIMMDPFSTLER